MGGVDLTGSYIGRNRIPMRTKKWYMRMFYHLLDLAIANCWLLFERKNLDIPITLPKFRQELAYCLLKFEKKDGQRGRPAIQPTFRKTRKIVPPLDLRQGENHLPDFSSSRGRSKIS